MYRSIGINLGLVSRKFTASKIKAIPDVIICIIIIIIFKVIKMHLDFLLAAFFGAS